MRPKVLLKALQWIFTIAVLFHIFSFVFNIYMNTIWDKSPNETHLQPDNQLNYTLRKMATIYKQDGFKIPVRMQVGYQDTIVQIAGELNTSTKDNQSWIFSQNNVDNRHWKSGWPASLEKWEKYYAQKYDTIYNVDTLITRAVIEEDMKKDFWRGEKVEERYQENIFDLVNFQPDIKTWINVKPKQQKHFLLMLIKGNLSTLFYIVLFYQLMMTVKNLNFNFTFSTIIYYRVKLVGYVLLVYSLLQLFLDYCLKSIYSFISVESSSTSINYIDGFHIYMRGHLDFHFHTFYIGILLLILGVLMKRSSEIEDAWSLTI